MHGLGCGVCLHHHVRGRLGEEREEGKRDRRKRRRDNEVVGLNMINFCFTVIRYWINNYGKSN